jgi:hypothetical protein
MDRVIRSQAFRCHWLVLAVVAAALLPALMLPARAQAHVPFIESPQPSEAQGTTNVPYPQAQTLPSPTISRAVYGFLAPGSKLDAYTFTVAQEVATEVSLIVPKRMGLQSFRPSLSIYSENSGKLQRIRDPGTEPRTSFYEPFSIASFWYGPVKTFTFKPGERYYAVIEPPDSGRKSGAYVLTFGGAEQFSAGDWATSIAAMPSIWLGSWAGGPVRPGLNVCGVTFVALAVVALWLWIRRTRRRSMPSHEPADPPPASEV